MSRVLGACVGLALALLAAGDLRVQAQPAPGIAQSQPAGPAVKTDAQFDAERRARDEQAALNDELLIFAALLVAVIALLALGLGVLSFYQSLTLRAMSRSAELAERNIAAAKRAFVYVSTLNWKANGAEVRISPVWVNAGATPTRRLRIGTHWKASHGELPADFGVNYPRPPEGLFLGPNGTAEFGTVLIPMRDIEAALEGRLHLFVWGRATYDDMFEDGKPHHFQFCHRIEVTGEAPDKIEVRFSQFGMGNGTDEDSRQQPAEES
jgi:hypothetical protein